MKYVKIIFLTSFLFLLTLSKKPNITLNFLETKHSSLFFSLKIFKIKHNNEMRWDLKIN